MKSQNYLLAFLLVFASIAGLRGQCPNPPVFDLGLDMVNTCTTLSIQIDVAQLVAGGVPPYSYLWNNGSTSSLFTNIQTGFFCLTITDAEGCTATDCVTITEDADIPIAQITPVGPLGCGTNVLTLNASGSSTGPQYIYLWTTPNGNIVSGASTLSPVINQPGTYFLEVTNLFNGCNSTSSIDIGSAGPVVSTVSVFNISCFGGSNGKIDVSAVNGIAPYSFEMSGPNGYFMQTTTPIFTNLPPGVFILKVTDGVGCESVLTIELTEPPPLTFNFNIDQGDCSFVNIIAGPQGGSGGVWWSWSGPNGLISNLPGITIMQSGVYFASITDLNNCIYIDSISVGINADSCALITGKILFDENENCLFENGETGLANWILEATDASGLHFYGYSDSIGRYEIHAPAGNYTVNLHNNGPFWDICQASQPAIISSAGHIDTLDFLVKAVQTCPHLTVNLSSTLLRRCFSNNFYHFTVCNDGTAAASDFSVEIQLDPFLSPTNSSVPYTNLGGGLLRFEFDTLAIGDCKTHWLQVTVSCDATLGQTHCSEATVALGEPCGGPTGLTLLTINHDCQPDNLNFSIENAPGNPIPVAFEYVVIEDAVMHVGGSATLQPGQQTTVAVPSNGSTWRVEALPIPPLDLFANYRSVEGCGTNAQGEFSTGFVVQFAQNTIDPSVDIDCRPNIGSYDPNDKSALPVGFGPSHFIDNQTVIEYQIRFQNTGTDTAFTVVVRDTLPAELDVNTFRPGSASHDYDLEIDGRGILIFRFENIFLPDSNTNEAASHGFLTFEIQPENDLPDGSIIENEASIYFDFNAPILTNTVFHTIGHEFVPSGVQVLPTANSKMTVAPNPFDESAFIEIEKAVFGKMGLFRLFDSRGLELRREEVGLPKFEVKKDGLASGIYLFSLSSDGVEIGAGRLIVR